MNWYTSVQIYNTQVQISGSAQDFGISIANAQELLQPCTEISKWSVEMEHRNWNWNTVKSLI